MQEGPLAAIRQGGFFVERAAAETEPRWKQIIPYCLIRFGDQLFVTRRLARGGETRLHGKRSIGIGGHINPVDAAEGAADRFEVGMRREVEEEILLPGAWSPTPLGWINDDTTEVGAVHVGLVFGIRSTSSAVSVRETDKLAGALEALVELPNSCENETHWETWSRLVLVRASEWVTRF
jgi:predicted NUDIX family phosphoesterase